jgi:hypothetical protein
MTAKLNITPYPRVTFSPRTRRRVRKSDGQHKQRRNSRCYPTSLYLSSIDEAALTMNGLTLRLKVLVLICGLLVPGIADAECSKAKIKRLYKQGETIASIGKTCDMDKAEIKDIVEEDAGDDKLAPGAALGACGCWGPVAPQARRPAPECQSGVARPRMCPGLCPMGGAPWQDVCAR